MRSSSCEVQILARITFGHVPRLHGATNPLTARQLVCDLHIMGVTWFRQVVKGTEITGMLPPYGAKARTDEDIFYGELKAA